MSTDALDCDEPHSLGTERGNSMILRTMAASVLLIALGAGSSPAQSRDTMQRYSADFAKPNAEPAHDGSIRVTFFGTSMLLLTDGTTKILIDGFITRPGSGKILRGDLLETDTVLVGNVLKHHGIDHLDALFVSHSHYDYALDVAYIAKQTGATLYGSPSTCNIGQGGGVPHMKCFCTDLRADYPVGPKFVVTVLPSKHSPPTLANNDLGERIEEPLTQPAKRSAYKEGNSVDFLIRYGDHSILVKPSANFLPPPAGETTPHANVLFLGTGRLGNQGKEFRKSWFRNTVVATGPTLVVPIHWDNFFDPLSEHLTAPARVINDVPVAFDFLKAHLGAIKFRIMQGCQSILLFKNGGADISEDSTQTSMPDTCV